MKSKELREKRRKLIEEARGIIDAAENEGRAQLNAEESAKYDRIMADAEQCRQDYERIETLEQAEADLVASRGRRTETRPEGVVETNAQQDRDAAFRAWMLGDQAAPADIDAAQRVGFDLRRPQINLRALDTTDTSAGGYTVQDEMMRMFFESRLWFANLRAEAMPIRTATGGDLPVPTVTDTTNSGEIVTQNSALTTTADPTFGQVTLGAFMYSSKTVLVPLQMVQDSYLNMGSYLGRALGTRIGRIQAAHFATGTGTGEPQGYTAGAGTGKTAALTNAITFDEIMDLTHSLDVAWRPMARFRGNDLVIAAIRKLKNGMGDYIWQPSTQVGVPDQLLGKPLDYDNAMASSITTSAKVLAFGDFYSGYAIRDAGDVTLFRFNELYMGNLQIGFTAFQRTDAKVIGAECLKLLVMSS